MSDLTKRLRNKANTLCDEAAAEIEALKAESNKYAREMLEEFSRANKAEADRDRLREDLKCIKRVSGVGSGPHGIADRALNHKEV